MWLDLYQTTPESTCAALALRNDGQVAPRGRKVVEALERRGGQRALQVEAASSAVPIAAGSPTGTSWPCASPFRISAGPLGQSVLTTGAPQARAWTRTFGEPS